MLARGINKTKKFSYKGPKLIFTQIDRSAACQDRSVDSATGLGQEVFQFFPTSANLRSPITRSNFEKHQGFFLSTNFGVQWLLAAWPSFFIKTRHLNPLSHFMSHHRRRGLFKINIFQSISGDSRSDVVMKPFIVWLTCYRPNNYFYIYFESDYTN